MSASSTVLTLVLLLYSQLSKPKIPLQLQNTDFYCSSISPEGKTIAVGYGGVVSVPIDNRATALVPRESIICTFDLITGKVLQRLIGHKGEVKAVCFSPNGRLLLSSDSTGRILLWDTETGKCIREVANRAEEPVALAFSLDSGLLCANIQAQAYVWEVKSGKLVSRIKHSAWISALAIAPTSGHLCMGGTDGTVQVCELKAGKQKWATQAHSAPITSIIISPDARRVFSGAGDCFVKGWDLETGRSVFACSPIGVVYDLHVSGDGHLLLYHDKSAAVLLDATTGAKKHKWSPMKDTGCTVIEARLSKLGRSFWLFLQGSELVLREVSLP